MNMRMPGWFDIVSTTKHPLPKTLPTFSNKSLQRVLDGGIETMRENEDAEGIKASAEYLNSLIEKEIAEGIPADRIVLGGFSQGGAMSIYTGLTTKWKLAGIVSLSGWLLLSKTFREVLAAGPKANENTPILMCQGASDELVRPQLSQLSYQMLNTVGLNVTHKEYRYVALFILFVALGVSSNMTYTRGLGHAASPEEMDDVENFLKERLPPKAADEGKSEL